MQYLGWAVLCFWGERIRVLVHHKTENCHASLTVVQQGSVGEGLEERPTGR